MINRSLLLNRFFKGVFKLRPTSAKYNTTWDVGLVLRELESWGVTESLDLKKLTLKLVMLLALGSAFRVQNLSFIKLENTKMLSKGVEIRIVDLIKTSRLGADQPYVFLPFFQNKILCIARTLLHYIEITKSIRGDISQLLISYRKPHRKVGTQTISRWLRVVMKIAGIDEQYTAHTTRHASTSKALNKGLNLNLIKKAAGWSENSRVFAKFYNRPIRELENFSETVFS